MPAAQMYVEVYMKTLEIDIETYSDVDLAKCGVYRYSQSSDFQILLVTYGFDDEELVTVDMARGEPLNGRMRAEDEFDALDADDEDDFLS